MKVCLGCNKEKHLYEFLNASIDKEQFCHDCYLKSRSQPKTKDFDYPQNLWDERCKSDQVELKINEFQYN